MKEIYRLMVNNYYDRMSIVQALNNSGYGTKIEEIKIPYSYSGGNDYYIVIYQVKDICNTTKKKEAKDG